MFPNHAFRCDTNLSVVQITFQGFLSGDQKVLH
jgi:hypothetical protein